LNQHAFNLACRDTRLASLRVYQYQTGTQTLTHRMERCGIVKITHCKLWSSYYR